ncbi:DegT/DnrJ/EryC1/StrS family aminotransferase [Halioxenophilus sp. WMMB6]|uniref:DegT/DnrJ/EryC1/StrS family aminotransferase n=1 Tax=Halioxenophilus sp. WMMB6 TaxID=3073815 RepID=UPI00295E672A|nr:aminotransferase class I/II-fold pyridoxal phosphate-dependent enzyme [Halioxenophilus sp. WMMB6]
MIPLMVPDLPSTDEILPWLRQIDHNHWYSNYGPLCLEFETQLVALLKAQNPRATEDFAMVSTCSGTTALEVGLSAYRLRPGTRVVLPSLTFPATATAIIRSGLIPVLADVDSDSWVLTPEIATGVVAKSGAKVVMPVAAYGQTLDTEAWQKFAAQYDCQVLIDSAGAFPAHTPKPRVDIAYSFHATKSLGIGEGGGLLSIDREYLQTARELTNFGFGKGIINTVGMNAKLSEYHAAVGLCQIERFPQMKSRRRIIYRKLRERLQPLRNALTYQSGLAPNSPTLFVVAVPGSATAVCQALEAQQIGVRQWYCPPLHQHPAFDSYIKNASLKFGDLTVSEQLSDRIIGLPFHLQLNDREMRAITRALTQVLANTTIHFPEPVGANVMSLANK